MTNSLRRRVAIVTGAGSGIGRAIATRLAEEGASVGLVARNLDRLKSVEAEIGAAGGRAVCAQADLTDGGAAGEAVKAIEDALGPTDILVNCAGLFQPTPVGETDLGAAQQMFDTNVGGVLAMTEAVAPGMRERGAGAILNVASVAGVMAVNGFAVYAASKAAVIMLTRTHARELAPFGIRVNALAPGNTETPMNEGARADAATLEAFTRITPSGRPFSPVSDMAEAALFLVSGRCPAMVGAVLIVDEGISLGN
jgi:3-oxoacyl-[acyl-carrier protein] reductase